MNIKEQIISLKESIKNSEESIKNFKEKIKIIQSNCHHEDINVNTWGSAECNICEKNFGWYCPTSPTLECDYEQEDGTYNDDCCRYCGLPEERK